MTCKTNSNKLKISINKEVLKHIEKSINNRIQIIVTNKKNSLQSHNTQCMLIQKVQNVQFLKKYHNFKNIGHRCIIPSHHITNHIV